MSKNKTEGRKYIGKENWGNLYIYEGEKKKS